jgi:hypothetical protein
VYSSISFPHDVYEMNRMWICLPRNKPGLDHLRLYSTEARFEFLPPQADTTKSRSLQWFPPDGGTPIKIQSPLARYLNEQRTGSGTGDWTRENGQIIAKDYAIVARFSDKREHVATSHGTIKDFFIAGIRGLGTWGAAWFIDRKYRHFLAYEDREDTAIQILLEVTYKNEAIHDVQDVSDRPQSYFEHENTDDTVHRTIQEHREVYR